MVGARSLLLELIVSPGWGIKLDRMNKKQKGSAFVVMIANNWLSCKLWFICMKIVFSYLGILVVLLTLQFFLLQIKNLAAELCLDRALVLQMLRDPPPNLLMLSAALPDEPAPKKSVPEETTVETTIETVVETTVETVVETTTDAAEVKTAVKVPIHVRQQKFAAQKRVKKVHLDTLERVYRRTKRPTVSKSF